MECGDCELGCKEKSSRMGWKSWLVALLGGWVLVGGLLLISSKRVAAKSGVQACLSREQVTVADKEMGKCLTIFGGGVYDFTVAKKWDLSGHVGKHLCGKEYDQQTIEKGPHKLEVIDKFYLTNVCGEEAVRAPVKERPKINWLTKVNWRLVSAYASLIFFLLNFLTCYAMPWSRVRQPWEGEVPGHDRKDPLGRFPLTYWHKYFAWLAIFTLSLHGALGFACALFSKCY